MLETLLNFFSNFKTRITQTPQLLYGDSSALKSLRLTIALGMLSAGLIVLVTAAVMTLAGPATLD